MDGLVHKYCGCAHRELALYCSETGGGESRRSVVERVDVKCHNFHFQSHWGSPLRSMSSSEDLVGAWSANFWMRRLG